MWNYGIQPNKYKEGNIITVEQGIDNFCPPWVETELPVLDNVNGDPFLHTPLDIELNSELDSVKVESSLDLDGTNYKVIKYLLERAEKVTMSLI